MIAQLSLTVLLAIILLYAWIACARAPMIGVSFAFAASAGFYFVWVPGHATELAEFVGIGRGVDLIIYLWIVISLIMLLNLHLKLREQMELITILVRTIAIAKSTDDARRGRQPAQGPAMNSPDDC